MKTSIELHPKNIYMPSEALIEISYLPTPLHIHNAYCQRRWIDMPWVVLTPTYNAGVEGNTCQQIPPSSSLKY